MRGHLHQSGKNSYAVVLSLGTDPATGKRKQHWESVKGSRKKAERRLAELLHEYDNGTLLEPNKTTLGEFLERWLREYAATLSPNTVEGYEQIIRSHIIPSLGNMPLNQLRPEHLQKYYSEKLSNGRCDGDGALSALSVRHHHVALHSAFESAVKWGLLSRNPADAVSPPHIQRREMQTWSENEIAYFLDAAKKSSDYAPYYAFFYTALYTGMRRNEMLGLRWGDIDFILSQIHVSRSLQHLKTGEFDFRPPKTQAGRRSIDMPPSLNLVLKEYQGQQRLDLTMLGKSLTNEDRVFTYADGKPFLPDSVTHVWMKMVRQTGLKPIRLHDARHTHASLMLKQGVHPKIVQERLGHASIQITLDTYSHVTPGLQQAAAQGFDKLFNHKPKSEVAHNFG